MRKQIICPLGLRQWHSELIASSLGLLRNQNLSHKCKKICQGIPYLTASHKTPIRFQKRPLDISRWNLYAFCEQLTLRSLVSQRLCGHETYWMRTMWMPRVRMKLLWMKQEWGAWNIHHKHLSPFTTTVSPQETSLQHFTILQRTVWKLLP